MQTLPRLSGSIALCWLAAWLCTACRPAAPSAAPAAPASAAERAGAVLAGKATFAGGADASGIQVFIPGGSHAAFADASGAFVIEGIGAGTHRVLAVAPGYKTAVVAEGVEVTAEGAAARARIVLEPVELTADVVAAPSPAPPALGAIEGAVTLRGAGDDAAVPLAGARIAISDGPYRTVTSDDGTFLLWNLPADEYALTIQGDGITTTTTARVLPGETTRIDLTLERAGDRGGASIRGIVELYTAAGERTADFDKITVRIADAGQGAPVSAEGTFNLAGLARGRHVVLASGSGYSAAAPVEVDLATNPTAEIVLRLIATAPPEGTGGRIAGFAIKAGGAPDGNSGISVALAGTQLAATTNELGRFVFENVPPGSYKLIATAAGFREGTMDGLEVAAGQETDAGGIYLESEKTAPRVIAADPPDGARNVPVRREMPVTITFDRAMDLETLPAAIAIAPPVPFRVELLGRRASSRGQPVRLVLSGAGANPVQYKTRYNISISRGATAEDGAQLAGPYAFSFTTGAAAVIGTIPEDGGVKGEPGPQSPVTIHFNVPMDHSTFTADVIEIRPALTAQPQFSAVDDPATGWTSLIVSATWNPATDYTVTVQRRARTRAREGLDNAPYALHFRTAGLRTLVPGAAQVAPGP